MTTAAEPYYAERAELIGYRSEKIPSILDGTPVPLMPCDEFVPIHMPENGAGPKIPKNLGQVLGPVVPFVWKAVAPDPDDPDRLRAVRGLEAAKSRMILRSTVSIMTPGIPTGKLTHVMAEAVSTDDMTARAQRSIDKPRMPRAASITDDPYATDCYFVVSGRVNRRQTVAGLFAVRATIIPEYKNTPLHLSFRFLSASVKLSDLAPLAADTIRESDPSAMPPDRTPGSQRMRAGLRIRGGPASKR